MEICREVGKSIEAVPLSHPAEDPSCEVPQVCPAIYSQIPLLIPFAAEECRHYLLIKNPPSPAGNRQFKGSTLRCGGKIQTRVRKTPAGRGESENTGD